MTAARKNTDRPDIDEFAFERGDDARLSALFASVAWFAVALLTWLLPNGLQADWAYAAVAACAFCGTAISLAVLTASWSRLSQRALRLAPWFLLAAVLVDGWLVFSHLGTDGL